MSEQGTLQLVFADKLIDLPKGFSSFFAHADHEKVKRVSFSPLPTDKEELLAVKRRVKNAFDRHVSAKACAKELGLSLYTIRDWYRTIKNGTFHEKKTDHYRISKRRVNAIKGTVLQMKKDGLSYNAISLKTGISPSTARSWVQKAEKSAEAADTEGVSKLS